MIDVFECLGETHEGRDNVLEISGVSREEVERLSWDIEMHSTSGTFQIDIENLSLPEKQRFSLFLELNSVTLLSLKHISDIDRVLLFPEGEGF